MSQDGPPYEPGPGPAGRGPARPFAQSGQGHGARPPGHFNQGQPPAYPPNNPQPPAHTPYKADQAFAAGSGLEWSRISKRHALHRLLTAVLWAVPVGGVGALLVWGNGGVVATAVWVGVIVLGVVLTWLVAELDRRAYGYAERADDLIVTHGVFVKRLIVVPYGRMQFVDVTAGLLERWMGIATVRMHTAAAATDATIPGLPAMEAAHLRDRLAHKGEERSMGL